MEKNSLWEQVENRCLELAKQALNKENASTAVTVETVEQLIGIAIAIDDLNFRWTAQNRYGAAGSLGQASGRPDDRKRLAGTIRDILVSQYQEHSLRQPLDPTSPELKQGGECLQK